MTPDPRARASAERCAPEPDMPQDRPTLPAGCPVAAPARPSTAPGPSTGVLAPSSAATLSALTASAWTPVAVRYRGPDTIDGWDWHLSESERLNLHCGVRDGVLLMAQRRRADGVWELVARRARDAERRMVE